MEKTEEWKKQVSIEEVEQQNMYEELEIELKENYKNVDRIIDERPAIHEEEDFELKDEEGYQTEYLVKWKYLPYSECTWEYENTIIDFDLKIKEFLDFKKKGKKKFN
jgi:hypothetical protein